VLTVAALVVGSSGVAAAVTGDPFAALKKMTHLVTGGQDGGGGELVAGRGGKKKDDGAPGTATHVAVFNKKMTGVGPMLAHGNADSARDLLDAALSDLVASGAEVPPGLQNRIDKLTDRIDNVASGGQGSGSPDGTAGGQGKGNGSDPADSTAGGQSKGKGKGKAADTSDPTGTADTGDAAGTSATVDEATSGSGKAKGSSRRDAGGTPSDSPTG